MGYITKQGEFGPTPDPELYPLNLIRRIAEQALRINEKLLAERKPRKRRKAA